MARARSPNRDKAFELFKEHNGDISNRKIAELLQEPEKTISSWKSRDKWAAKLNESECSTAKENECSTTNKERSTAKRGAPKGNKNAVGNKGGPPAGNKNAVGHGAPVGNDNAVTHGLFRKYLPAEVFELKTELARAFQNDPVSMIWESILLHYSNIIYSQNIMFVQDKDDTTRELRKQKMNEHGLDEEWDIQFAWDKQANLLNAQSRAFAEFRNLIKQFDELANKNDKRRLELKMMQLNVQKAEAEVKEVTDKGNKSTGTIIVNDKDEMRRILNERSNRNT
ncbi:TPA: terminase [Bacillus cereus]|uniref:phage terminase small subunit n=2 Tax=Bacilli TaxID=91061 RepID=UPI001C303D4C|nr:MULTISPECIES: phage terminase small subunit [Bacillales]MCP1181265.1 phage terminase small subunit [Bacillus sp. 1663tsa1]MCU5751615.1 phage terminase small subunit [Bacillus cereus]HDX9631447.1 terminase [Bacillus cereus]